MSRSIPRSSDNRNKALFGIDGCRGGWVVASASSSLNDLTIEFVPNLHPILEGAGTDSVVAIDIPIGLPENEPRACDGAARQLLGWPRSSSVFSPPCRRAFAGKTFKEVLLLNRTATGVGISKQAFHIMPKIREVDALMTTKKQKYIREVHPEVTFAQLNGVVLAQNKKSPLGRAHRIALLQGAGLYISEALLATRGMKPDDVIDAVACLLTAFAIQNGHSQCLGRREQTDAKGLVMEIVCVRSRGVATECSLGRSPRKSLS
jgi:predicted RNase H-like nuclease